MWALRNLAVLISLSLTTTAILLLYVRHMVAVTHSSHMFHTHSVFCLVFCLLKFFVFFCNCYASDVRQTEQTFQDLFCIHMASAATPFCFFVDEAVHQRL